MSDPIKNALFPDCEIHTMEQRSGAWDEIRANKLTGSNMGAWLAERPEIRATVKEIEAELDGCGVAHKGVKKRDDLLALASQIFLPKTHLSGTVKARHGAICGILGRIADTDCPPPFEVDPDGPPPRNPAQWAIWNGIRMEAEAVSAFEKWSGLEVEQVGFCQHKSGASGCSPDGLIKGKSWGFEGKAPLAKAHIEYLLGGVLPEAYRDQVHGSMACTGATGWWFQSYCPPLPAFRIFVERDEYTERIALGLDEFSEALRSAEDEIYHMMGGEL